MKTDILITSPQISRPEIDKLKQSENIENYNNNNNNNINNNDNKKATVLAIICLLYTSPSPRDKRQSRMPSSA